MSSAHLSGPCSVADYLQAIQATSVLACVFAILALFVFVAQLFTLPKGQRFTFTGVLQFLSCESQGGRTVSCYLEKHQYTFEAQCVANSSVQMTSLVMSWWIYDTNASRTFWNLNICQSWISALEVQLLLYLFIVKAVPDHVIGRLSASRVEVFFAWRGDPLLSCRLVYHDSSLHLHRQAPCQRSSGRLRALLRPGLDFVRLLLHPRHHLPRLAEEERVTGQKGGKFWIVFPVWIWDSE